MFSSVDLIPQHKSALTSCAMTTEKLTFFRSDTL